MPQKSQGTKLEPISNAIGVAASRIREERDRANGIIEKFADADMSQDEVFDLLVQNGISHQVATGIAQDMRPE